MENVTDYSLGKADYVVLSMVPSVSLPFSLSHSLSNCVIRQVSLPRSFLLYSIKCSQVLSTP